ncbi:hypothetical protein AB0L75_43275 [Streptomyces sp. NPDC052101]|uniref:hypothetical protein n=1 Tax=Streptomyces sp. NPDC052101 TaxID=3155763 RepID=UPI00343FC6EE
MTDPGVLAFPQDRTCPYQPPDSHLLLAARGPLSRVRLYDGREVWLVTGYDAARLLLSDPRVSADRGEGLLDDLARYAGGDGSLDRFTLVRTPSAWPRLRPVTKPSPS